MQDSEEQREDLYTQVIIQASFCSFSGHVSDEYLLCSSVLCQSGLDVHKIHSVLISGFSPSPNICFIFLKFLHVFSGY